jgi:hypothetical protein
MTNPLELIRQLGIPIAIKRSGTQPLKSRRLRRQEKRDRIRSAKVHQKPA